jgi:Ca-activated chloride channel family protein
MSLITLGEMLMAFYSNNFTLQLGFLGVALASLVSLFSNSVNSSAATDSSASDKHNSKTAVVSNFQGTDSGALAVFTPTGKEIGKCPLKHTSVVANISGYVNRVTVKQVFENPFKEKIEAVYTFPLSETAAVDDMLMKVGNRTIHGTIKRREEAQQLYDAAKSKGQLASLLNQERPNIFSQNVANIRPGDQIEVVLSYVDLLPYEQGTYSFVFPTVVGPRFIPGNPNGKQGQGRLPDTDQVPDASLITPVTAKKGERAGHDISIDVNINSGIAINNISSKLHEVAINKKSANSAHISLVNKNTIPNKDFVLTYDVASDKLQSGYLTHGKNGAGYFTIMVMPPKKAKPEQIAPKEMIFLIDCSGSQHGAPLDKAKETLSYIVEHMNANDTFQIISFNDNVAMFADKPQLFSESMKKKAKQFINKLEANGGTWMAPAVEKACAIPADNHRLRIVTFMTDGYVGNDFEVVDIVKKLRGQSRWFPFGTGNGVNRLLIDNMAKEGGGEAEYVLLNSAHDEVGKKFYDRIASPVLTDIKVDFHGLPVKEVYPSHVSDVWAEKPLYIKGRYTGARKGIITISGYAAGKPYKQDISIDLPTNENDNSSLGSIWARAKVDRLMSEDWLGAQKNSINKELKEEIVKTALEHHIMSQYTSFVAIEDKVVKGDKGEPRTIAVPVEMPDGVSYDMNICAEGRLSGVGGGLVRMRQMASSPKPYPGKSKAGLPVLEAPEPSQLVLEKRKSNCSPQLSDAEKDKQSYSKKASPALQTLFSQTAKHSFDIVNGTIGIKLIVKNTEASTLDALKKLGIKIVKIKNKEILCRVPISKLVLMAQLDEVISFDAAKVN